MDDAETLLTWAEREREWRRKLGRIRIGVEPIPEQLEKYRRMTWVLTAVAGGIGVMFVALFSAFRSPWLGLGVAGVLMGPVLAGAWLGFRRTERRVAAYLRACEEVERLRRRSASDL